VNRHERTTRSCRSGQLQGLKLGRMKVSTIELDNFLMRNAGKDLTDPYDVKPLRGVN
jgi:hypothetical protein